MHFRFPKSGLGALILALGVAGGTAWAHGGGEGPPQATLKRLFPAADNFVTRPLELNAEQKKQIQTRLGAPLAASDLANKVYIPSQNGQSLGVIWITEAHLKEGLADVLVGLDRQGHVAGVALEHSPVAALAQSSYLKQYLKLTTHSAFQVGRDLKPLAGNPAASKLVAAAAHKAAVVIDVAFLGGK